MLWFIASNKALRWNKTSIEMPWSEAVISFFIVMSDNPSPGVLKKLQTAPWLSIYCFLQNFWQTCQFQTRLKSDRAHLSCQTCGQEQVCPSATKYRCACTVKYATFLHLLAEKYRCIHILLLGKSMFNEGWGVLDVLSPHREHCRRSQPGRHIIRGIERSRLILKCRRRWCLCFTWKS